MTKDVRRRLKEWIKEERDKRNKCPIITTEVVKSLIKASCRDWLCQHRTDDLEQDEQAFTQECFPAGRWAPAGEGLIARSSMAWFQEEWHRMGNV